MVQPPPPSGGEEGTADLAASAAGQGAGGEAGQRHGNGGEQDAGLPFQCWAHDTETGSRLPCCCSRCLRGRAPWRCGTPGINKKKTCPGLGLFYTLLSACLFSVASLFLKKVEDVHSVEASAIRCVFQMLFVLPGLIYYKRESLTLQQVIRENSFGNILMKFLYLWIRQACVQNVSSAAQKCKTSLLE